MTTIDEKIAEYYAMNPTTFRILKSFCIAQAADSGEMKQNVSLVLTRDDTFSGVMLYLECVGVRDMVFRQPSWSLVTLSHVQVAASQSSTNPRATFLVCDPEEHVFSLLCEDIVFHRQ